MDRYTSNNSGYNNSSQYSSAHQRRRSRSRSHSKDRERDHDRDHRDRDRDRDRRGGDDRFDRRSYNNSNSNYRNDRDAHGAYNTNRDRDRDRGDNNTNFNNKGGSSGDGDRDFSHRRVREDNPPSKTVVIKGLPSHTTDASETGDCKGFAFVEFYSVEYSQYFLNCYAGSTSKGDSSSPQLIVDNRAVVLEFAREGDSHSHNPQKHEKDSNNSRNDWICDKCSILNFSRRSECFKCATPRSSSSQVVANTGNSSRGEGLSDSTVSSSTPNETLCIRGISPYCSEDALTAVFRQYAPVKSVLIPRDTNSAINRGFAFVEFFSIEHATYALQMVESTQLQMEQGGPVLRVVYAKPSFLAAQLALQSQAFVPALSSQHLPPPTVSHQTANSLAAAALQAAQWKSVHNQSGTASAYSVAAQPPVPPQFAYGGIGATPTAATSGAVAVAGAYAGVLGSKQKPHFPPLFDKNGAAYVFQTQSGYFYEPISEYYYCPKSKLYYNSIDGTYYAYDETISPPFRRFYPSPPSSAPTEATPFQDSQTVAAAAAAELARKPVVLSISSTVKGKTKPPGGTAMSLPQSKKIVNNLAKWNAAKEEDSDTEEARAPTTAAASNLTIVSSTIAVVAPTEASNSASDSTTQTAAATIAVASSATSSAAATTAATFVCLLCRRQFNSSEQLKRHEKESKLHAENLAKLAAATAATAANSAGGGDANAMGYRDRAAERRAVQGDSIPPPGRARTESFDEPAPSRRPIASTVTTSASTSIAVSASTESNPVYLDAENPGNVLLRKMGWSEGKGLGKEESGIEAPIEAGNRAANAKTGVGSNDLESQIAYGDKSTYKESILKATKARFDRIS